MDEMCSLSVCAYNKDVYQSSSVQSDATVGGKLRRKDVIGGKGKKDIKKFIKGNPV